MFDKEKVKGASIGVKFCGYDLQSPFIVGSGPLTYGSEGMIRAHQAGVGAVVTPRQSAWAPPSTPPTTWPRSTTRPF